MVQLPEHCSDYETLYPYQIKQLHLQQLQYIFNIVLHLQQDNSNNNSNES
jgi:hypothetical protein